VRKPPVSIALSNRLLEKIAKEASKQRRSRSEFVELHFETLFFAEIETENKLFYKNYLEPMHAINQYSKTTCQECQNGKYSILKNDLSLNAQDFWGKVFFHHFFIGVSGAFSQITS
jgi:hypothetical protein